MEKSTLIKDYSSALVKGFYEKCLSIKDLQHNLSKGEFRELFVNDLLSNFLSTQFGVGSGVIVDSNGNQSKQVDIIIYDRRIIPPIIQNGNLGVYPIEGVLCIVEVKSNLTKEELEQTEKNFEHLDKELSFNENFEKEGLSIRKGIIGINRNAIRLIRDNDDSWLSKNIRHIDTICHIQSCCWIKYPRTRRWHYEASNEATFEETKRFIAWILDTARNKSNRRYAALSQQDVRWLSIYTRNQ